MCPWGEIPTGIHHLIHCRRPRLLYITGWGVGVAFGIRYWCSASISSRTHLQSHHKPPTGIWYTLYLTMLSSTHHLYHSVKVVSYMPYIKTRPLVYIIMFRLTSSCVSAAERPHWRIIFSRSAIKLYVEIKIILMIRQRVKRQRSLYLLIRPFLGSGVGEIVDFKDFSVIAVHQ